MNELRLECDIEAFPIEKKNFKYFKFTFNFARTGLLNESLNLTAFKNLSFPFPFIFKLTDIKGFDVELSRSLVLIDESSPWINVSSVVFAGTKLDFYYKGSLIDAGLCDTNHLRNLSIHLFSNLYLVRFIFD